MYHIGDIVEGTVTGIQSYGAFVSLNEQHQGLIHISECHHGYVKNIGDYLSVNQKIKVMVLDIDEYNQKISLSMRTLDRKKMGTVMKKYKHFWSDKTTKTGFEPIAIGMPELLEEALKRIDA